MWNPLKIGELVAPVPIVQGGMGIGVSFHKLASAVANAGGIGIISAVLPGFRESDFNTNPIDANTRALKKEIKKAKELTKGIVGVNIMVALTNYADMAKAAIEAGADLIISGAGMPFDLPKYKTPGSKTKLVPIVSSERAARLIVRRWKERYDYLPDAFVVEGPKSGGHQGVKMDDLKEESTQVESELPKVVAFAKEFADVKDIPVIAAGGISSGADIKRMFELGASGVQIGTLFVATDECDADIKFKEEYTKLSKPEDITVIKSPVGLPLRVINNSFVKTLGDGTRKPKVCPFHCLITCDWQKVDFCIASALMVAHKGGIENGVLCCGADGYKNNKIVSVGNLISRLQKEYEQA